MKLETKLQENISSGGGGLIEGKIKEIQNQKPFCERRMNLGTRFN
jgi:hypothetical protein